MKPRFKDTSCLRYSAGNDVEKQSIQQAFHDEKKMFKFAKILNIEKDYKNKKNHVYIAVKSAFT